MAQPRFSARRGSLPATSRPAPANWPRHAQDDAALARATPALAFAHNDRRRHQQQHNDMKFIQRVGTSGNYPPGVRKLAPPTTGFASNQPIQPRTPSPHAVQLPEGTLHVWIYQARQLVFRRLFETMYERHGLRLRVYASSRTTQDVGEIYETRRNYGGNMANPRWRRDQDDARDDAHGHFSIPLSRKSLRSETELSVEIVCGILVVAHTKISLPGLFLGSFGTTLESLATSNMQFRPHWFPLDGEDAGLIEMALEFIPTRLVKEQQEHQRQHSLQKRSPHQHPRSNQPESEYDDYDQEARHNHYDHDRGYDEYHQQYQYKEPYAPQRRGSRSSDVHLENEMDRQRAREYEALERQEQLRRQRFEMLEDPHETRPQERARSATTASSSSSSSARSSRFTLPRRQSMSDLDSHEDLSFHYHQPQYEVEGGYYEEEEVVIMDGYENSPPPSEFSGYEFHDSRYEEHTVDDVIHEGTYESRSSMNSEYDDLSLSASSSWASVSTLNDTSQENLLNKQLWDLYRYGISDEAPEEINVGSRIDNSTADSASLRDTSVSMSSVSSSVISRKMSTMSQASNFSVAFSDASEASMMSREASTCASEILTYNDRIQRMEEAIRAARERRLAEEAAAVATAAIAPQNQGSQPEPRRRPYVPAPISTTAPARPPTSITAYGWERTPPPSLASPATSEPVVVESRKGVVLFDMDHIPVKGQSGQTDPALEAYRAKMLARRRSLPVHMLSGGSGPGGLGLGGATASGQGGFPPPLVRELSAPLGRLSMRDPEPLHPGMQAACKYDHHASPSAWGGYQQHFPHRDDRQPNQRFVGVVDKSHPAAQPKVTSDEEPSRSSRPSDNDRGSTGSIDGLPGPPSLGRKRSSSLHSISDLLRDQSFRIHNIAVTPSPAERVAPSSRPPSRQSVSDHSSGRPSVAERKLSKASSYASSDASSNGQQIVPTVHPTSGAPPRVRRNSKSGGNVVQINGIALGIGKFINVGNVPGVIRYIGPTMFAPGQWIGIELVEKKGKHNGTVQNVQYFECAPEHGIFIRAERLDIST